MLVGVGMRLPNAAHEAHPWVIARIAPDFKLLDVWALPVEGGPDDFGTFLDVMRGLDPAAAGSAVSRFLFWVRFRLGEAFGWDDPDEARSIPGRSETSLSDRLPEDLRQTAHEFAMGAPAERAAGGFVPLYCTANEAAAEISNSTVHGVLHLGWVEQAPGRFRSQLAVYVKPRGRLGDVYMLLIDPFRHRIVYPALLRQIGAAWEARAAADDEVPTP